MCSDGWSSSENEIDGECPDCGEPTVDGYAASGCNYSPITCETCGARPCDGSCQEKIMYKLPMNLTDLDHFRTDKRVQFKEENVGGLDVVIPCYAIADSDFWKLPYAIEMRGHVYRKDTGELVSAALPKMFNCGENADTLRDNLPWGEVSCVSDKIDGSMISFIEVDGKLYAKTKKSFYSDVAVLAQEYVDAQSDEWKSNIIQSLHSKDSPIMEFFHPDWQIVLNYGSEPTMKYLGIRDMLRSEWLPSSNITHANQLDIVKNLESYQEGLEGIEGYVIKFIDGRVIKAKTLWYILQHRCRTQMRVRDVAELAALEKLDDVKSLVSESGLDLSLIEKIESDVSQMISNIRYEVETIANSGIERGFDAKTMSFKFKGHLYFGLIMLQYRGKDPDYVEWFLKNCLKKYFGLSNVYNSKF